MSETAPAVPVIEQADVLVIGGSTAAVAAAVQASQGGASVFVAVAETYLGEDLAAHARWWWPTDGSGPDTPNDPLLTAAWSNHRGERVNPAQPLRIKHSFDEAFLDAGVRYLFGLQPLHVFRDDSGTQHAVVFATRSGVMAVQAQVVIDASPRALAARAAGLRFQPWQSGDYTVQRIVLGPAPRPGPDLVVEPLPAVSIEHKDRKGNVTVHEHEAHRCHVTVHMDHADPAAFAAAEHTARDRTWQPDQVMGCDRVFWPSWPDTLVGAQRLEQWPEDPANALAAMRGEAERFWVLSRCSDLGEAAATAMAHPANAVAVGRLVGEQAATQVQPGNIGPLSDLRAVARGNTVGLADGERLLDVLSDVRPVRDAERCLPAASRDLPLLEEVDVLVVGGGTGGAPAGIAAAREGAKSLVLESLSGLGGVGTLGLICVYYHGYREGFTAEVTQGLLGMATDETAQAAIQKGSWRPDHKAEWLRQQLRAAGGEVWFNAVVSGVIREGDRVTAVEVATPFGSGLIRGKQVIDATGNADVPAFAGGDCVQMAGGHVAVQGTGLPPMHAPSGYTNTDYDFVEDADLLDVWRAFLNGREKFREAFDLGQLVDSRERRQILGEFVIDPVDIFAGRTYPDSVALSRSNFDTHGFTIHPLFVVQPPDRESIDAYVPLRALTAKGLANVMATGLGLSGHRDAMPVLRMQACTQNHAFAAGTAAARAVQQGCALRQLDLGPIREAMAAKGTLPSEALSHGDSFPVNDAVLSAAIQAGGEGYRDIAVLLSDPPRSVPLLRQALPAARDDVQRQRFAMLLAVMGDDGGADVLLSRLSEAAWDEGWNYRGMGQFGMSLSELDRVIVALAMASVQDALPRILALAKSLDAEHAFSHHRAVAIACERFADPQAAPVLAEILQKPDMRGHAFTDIKLVRDNIPQSHVETGLRNVALRELHVARALYRCGDAGGLGEAVLREYAADFRGSFARHARAVLAGHPPREADPMPARSEALAEA